MLIENHIVPNVIDEPEYRRIVRERLNILFGNKKNVQETNFVNVLLERGRICLLTITFFFMVCYVMFALASADTLYRYPQYLLQRCVIPELEDHFSHKEIAAILRGRKYTNFPSSHCHYQDRNYEELLTLSNNSFANIMTEIGKQGPAPWKLCKKSIIYYNTEGEEEKKVPQDKLSFYRFYDLHCSHESLQAVVQVMPYLGYLLGLPVGILSDIYGRRFVFIVLLVILMVSTHLLLIPNKVTLLIARFFLGLVRFASMIVLIIFIEQANVKTRNYLTFITFSTRPMGRFFVRVVLKQTQAYYIRVIITAVMILPLIFVLWFMQESPRWLYFRGKKQQAWKHITVPEKFPTNFNDLSSELKRVTLSQHMHLFGRVIYRLRTFRHLFLMFSETILSFYYMIGKNEMFNYTSWSYFVKLNLALMSFTTAFHFGLIFFKRKTVMLTAHFILIIACAVNLLQTTESVFVLACDITQKALSEVCLFFIIYQSLELYPTPQRGTIVGMSAAVVGLSCFASFMIDYYFGDEKKTLLHTIGLTLVIVCTALAAFIPETYRKDLPDLPREALSSRFINVF